MTGTNGLARAMIWLVSQVASPLAKPSSAAGVLPGHAQHPQVVRPPGQVTLRTDAEMLELAAALKREKPGRTAAQGGAILRAHCAAGDVRPVRGIPRTSAEMRAAARLGIKITHSTTGRPRDPGRSKDSSGPCRNSPGRDRDGTAVATLADLNTLFTAWTETVYHARSGRTTRLGGRRCVPHPLPGQLREAFS